MSKTKHEYQNNEEIEESTVPTQVDPPEPHFLTAETLRLWNVWTRDESPRDVVPPQTPNSEYNFSHTFHPIPETFPELDDLEIPYVRDKGVKFCIDKLSEYFDCKEYKFNMLQFWFLDVLTDCIWTSQDNFHLPCDQQKIVLKWILYLINLLRDTNKNLSRKTFFNIFKEAMLVASEVIDEGCETVPLPEQLFAFILEDEDLKSWNSADSTSIKIDDGVDDKSYIDLEVAEKRRRYVLPQEVCNCAKYELSSVNSVGETISATVTGSEEKLEAEDETLENVEESDDEEFYQPDLDVPTRFLPFPEEINGEGGEEEEEKSNRNIQTSVCVLEIDKIQNADIGGEEESADNGNHTGNDQFDVYEIPERFCVNRTSEVSRNATSLSSAMDSIVTEELSVNQNKESIKSHNMSTSGAFLNAQLAEQYRKKQLLKQLASNKLWEQRLKDMANPRKGWISASCNEMSTVAEEHSFHEEETSEEPEDDEDEEWADIIVNEQAEQIQNDEDKLILNFGVLRAIIDFVFKYFYESFQYTLIKLAFQATPEIITQNLNHQWLIPKRLKQELQKPKFEKPKKPKEKKEKKEKLPKSPKKDKKDKKADKKDKKDSKKESKKEKKKGKEKPAKLTKEEKEELERQKREQALVEEELRKLEENKRFVFPLTDAASDDLFQNIFENWEKVDLTKKGKGKDKGGKRKR